MFDVFCISAGQLDVKKEANITNKKNMYLNYGLLAIASVIKQYNLKPIQLQGHFTNPHEFFEYCVSLGIADTIQPVFISIPSFYAISWVNKFTELLKKLSSKIQIIVGGRWVIDGEPDLLAKLLPNVDRIVDGLGENEICKYINIEKQIVTTSNYVSLDYGLLDQRQLYQPSVEVSRGCGMSCIFCQEKDEKLQSLKHTASLITEVNNTLLADDLIPMNLYFESSMFVPTERWLKELIIQRELHSINFKWRTESRVDSISVKLIPLLAKAGLKVLDLGLESASEIQLRNMGKSNHPDKYLNKASKLINTAYEFGIDIKINILIYAGETSKTIEQTYRWLYKHRKFIKGVSIGPVIAFGWDNKKQEFINSMEKLGAQVCDDNSIIGVTHIHPSREISNKKALMLSNEISREFMSAEDYFYLKSFSYYPRNYYYSDFMSDVNQNSGNYSFRVK